MAGASCVLLVAFLVQTFIWCRRRHRTTKVGYRLIDEQQPPVDYGTNQGTAHPGEGLTHSLLNPVGARAQKGKICCTTALWDSLVRTSYLTSICLMGQPVLAAPRPVALWDSLLPAVPRPNYLMGQLGISCPHVNWDSLGTSFPFLFEQVA